MEITLFDLKPEVQEKVLNFYDCKTPEDGNFDISSLFVLETDGQIKEKF